MLRVVKLYDLYCLNASILFEMVPFQVAQAACYTISYCQNLCFRFEIPWCALSCHKLNGRNGVGRISSSKVRMKNMHLVLLIIFCIVAIFFPGQKPGRYMSNQFHIAALFSSILESLVWCNEQSGWADVVFD